MADIDENMELINDKLLLGEQESSEAARAQLFRILNNFYFVTYPFSLHFKPVLTDIDFLGTRSQWDRLTIKNQDPLEPIRQQDAGC